MLHLSSSPSLPPIVSSASKSAGTSVPSGHDIACRIRRDNSRVCLCFSCLSISIFAHSFTAYLRPLPALSNSLVSHFLMETLIFSEIILTPLPGMCHERVAQAKAFEGTKKIHEKNCMETVECSKTYFTGYEGHHSNITCQRRMSSSSRTKTTCRVAGTSSKSDDPAS